MREDMHGGQKDGGPLRKRVSDSSQRGQVYYGSGTPLPAVLAMGQHGGLWNVRQ